jgi:hypothetical protein
MKVSISPKHLVWMCSQVRVDEQQPDIAKFKADSNPTLVAAEA